VDFHAV